VKTISTVAEMREISSRARSLKQTIGFVPTMGFLHDGHLSLIRSARSCCDLLVVSIFVNRTQFGPNEDFDSYPRDLSRDLELCRINKADLVFHPPQEDMYFDDYSVFVEETRLSRGLCGAARPGHFKGVTSVVCKLFNIIQPDFAVFGQKDAQQVRVIDRMVRDLNIPVEIRTAPIVREPDGLAMSSRNTYLSPEERSQALCLSKTISLAEKLHSGGELRASTIESAMRELIESYSMAQIDYVEIVDSGSLEPVEKIEAPTLVAIAVRIGSTRLIDNTVLGDS
jgi:pantoate--beta-alanine ligase